MAQSHTTGPINGSRMGAIIAAHSIPYSYLDSTKREILKIKASSTKPVLLELGQATGAAFAGTTPTVNVGSNSTASNEYISGQTPASAGQGAFSTTLRLLTSDTTLSVKTRSAAGAGTLTSDNTNVANNATVTIGTTVYTYKTALTPASGEVLIGADADASLLNLIRAINHSGTPGTDYANLGTTAVANTQVTAATSVTSHAFAVTAIETGTAGNSIATTETSTHLSWGAATLAGGADLSAGSGHILVNCWEMNIVSAQQAA